MYLPGRDFGAGGRRLRGDVELVADVDRRLVALVDHVFEDAVAGGEDAAGEVDDVAGAELADVRFAERDREMPLLRLAPRLSASPDASSACAGAGLVWGGAGSSG